MATPKVVPIRDALDRTDITKDSLPSHGGLDVGKDMGAGGPGGGQSGLQPGEYVQVLDWSGDGLSRIDAPAAPSEPGTYAMVYNGRWTPFDVTPPDGSPDVPSNFAGPSDSHDPGTVEEKPGADEIDPSNYRWIVNADNEEGVAPAPVLRRQGVDLGPNGSTFRFPNGETVDVGAIEDADEVARHLEGADAGDVIEADQDVVESGSESETQSNSDAIGASGALGLLALAYIGYRRQS